MATMGADRVLVDSNVWVYRYSPTSPLYSVAERKLLDLFSQGVELCVSPQIIREFCAALTRAAVLTHSPCNYAGIANIADTLIRDLYYLEETEPVSHALTALVAEYGVTGKLVHDANLVAIMQVYGITKLLSHNTGDFVRYSALLEALPLTD
jgi:predicted nucleic acid-binding protein